MLVRKRRRSVRCAAKARNAPSALAAPNPHDAHMSKLSNLFGVQLIHCGVIFCFLLFIGYEVFLLVSTIWSPDARSSAPRILIYTFFLLCYLAATHVVNLISERDGETGPKPDLRQVYSWGRALVAGVGRLFSRAPAGPPTADHADHADQDEARVRAPSGRGSEAESSDAHPGPLRAVTLAATAAARAWRAQWAQTRAERRTPDKDGLGAPWPSGPPEDAPRTPFSLSSAKTPDPLAAFIRGLDKNGAQAAASTPEPGAALGEPTAKAASATVPETAQGPVRFDFESSVNIEKNAASALDLAYKPTACAAPSPAPDFASEPEVASQASDPEPMLLEESLELTGAEPVQLDHTPGVKHAPAQRRLLTMRPVSRVNAAFLKRDRKA